jgi:hypothetical protein
MSDEMEPLCAWLPVMGNPDAPWKGYTPPSGVCGEVPTDQRQEG